MADFYHIVFNCWWVLWDNSLQIVGSLFVSLAIFEYFYRKYRQREIRKIKKILLKVLEMGKEYNRDDTEHEVLAISMENLSREIEENYTLLNTKMDANQRVLLTQYNSEFEVLNIRFDGFEKTLNSGIIRIKALEDDTHFIKTIKKYPKATFLAIIGFIALMNGKTIIEWALAIKDKILNIF